ncbi:hypothetical protein BWQ96_01500 [Gracilariopsis chorda]|uniref:Uncharacterized protein n=1 Tax=Gracilariopsis chorda TaxID=448386 RepID=A0A2V3J2L6_9FLOR|nr:hypothetical protein BWQ96_01500 [Gracilariopsis chorda]|eukprot:PXF48648.1 hypothetical protein BWQ96_01500 [Gracilariopsis chorda]
MGYFKPPTDAFFTELKNKDRRSSKKWEYISAAGVWTDVAAMAIEIERTWDGGVEGTERLLKLARKAFRAVLEDARQMAFLIEQGGDGVFSESYRTVHTALTARIEQEAAKQLAKAQIEKASGSRNRCGRAGGAAGEV